MPTRVAEILADTAHRPWPLPSAPWIMHQRWEDLLFIHWRIPIGELRPLVPAELAIDQFDGSAWLGLTPFFLAALRIRLLPRLPIASQFPELNLRTYVRVDGRPGVFFLTLEAASRAAVVAARAAYRLPYRTADMRVARDGEWIRYESRRVSGTEAEFVGRYRGVGEAWMPEPGSIEHFLTERYALYTVGAGIPLRGEIHHPRWSVQRAEAHITSNTVPAAHGIRLPSDEPLLHYASRQDTVIWPLRSAR